MTSRPRPAIAEIREWPPTISVADAALALGCSPSHAYSAIKSGDWPARIIPVGRRIRISTASVLAILEDQ